MCGQRSSRWPWWQDVPWPGPFPPGGERGPLNVSVVSGGQRGLKTMAAGRFVASSSKNRPADDKQEPAEGLIGNSCDTVGSPPSPAATHFLRKRDGPSAGRADVR